MRKGEAKICRKIEEKGKVCFFINMFIYGANVKVICENISSKVMRSSFKVNKERKYAHLNVGIFQRQLVFCYIRVLRENDF